jgi:RNA polymerase sigma-70 factor (ECF subfamily)
MVLRAGATTESQAHSALESLCRQYWYPLYTFVRRQGRTHHDAEDGVQSFLAHLLASDSLARARPELGRFRTFLLSALRNFLTNEWHRTRAAKRGGGQPHFPLEFDTAEERFSREPADPALTPEQAFDRNWAISMIDHAIAGLRDEYGNSGRAALFTALGPLVLNSSNIGSHAELAAKLGMNGHAFTVALQRLRKRLGERLRVDVAETVVDEVSVDAELRHLIAALDGPASFVP